VGSGKTTAGAAEAVALALENPGCDGMIVAPTWGVLWRTTLRKFLELLPREAIRRHVAGKRHYELHNGVLVHYGSADRADSLEGATLAWAWGDEARYWPKQAWTVLLARVREAKAKRRRLVLTTTPTLGWLHEQFGGKIEGHGNVVAPTEGNWHNPPEYLPTLRASYPERLYRQYVDGEWVMLEGAVYEEFSEALHVRDVLPGHGRRRVVECWLDLAYRRPHALFVEVEGDIAMVHGELCPDNVTLPNLLTQIHACYEEHGWLRGQMILDPAGKQVNEMVGYSALEVIDDRGWRTLTPRGFVERYIPTGVEVVRARLLGVNGEARLFFHPRLRETLGNRGIIQCLQGYAYPEAKDGRPVTDQPVKDGRTDHGCDALRYGLVCHYPPPWDTIRGG